MPYIVNMSDSIKTGIISVASKNGYYSRINYDQTAVTHGKFI